MEMAVVREDFRGNWVWRRWRYEPGDRGLVLFCMQVATDMVWLGFSVEIGTGTQIFLETVHQKLPFPAVAERQLLK